MDFLVPTLQRGNAVRPLQRPVAPRDRFRVASCSLAEAWKSDQVANRNQIDSRPLMPESNRFSDYDYDNDNDNDNDNDCILRFFPQGSDAFYTS
jgi:hypothetical protein